MTGWSFVLSRQFPRIGVAPDVCAFISRQLKGPDRPNSADPQSIKRSIAHRKHFASSRRCLALSWSEMEAKTTSGCGFDGVFRLFLPGFLRQNMWFWTPVESELSPVAQYWACPDLDGRHCTSGRYTETARQPQRRRHSDVPASFTRVSTVLRTFRVQNGG